MGTDAKQGENRDENLGQGLGNIGDRERCELVGHGKQAPTKDQAPRPRSVQNRRMRHQDVDAGDRPTLH